MEWKISEKQVPYVQALAEMEARVDAIIRGEKPELVWCLEHPSIITGGTSAKPEDIKDKERFEIIETGRGGQYTYHGPGQRVVYIMLDLKKQGIDDLRKYVSNLEQLVINTLKHFGVIGERREGRIGIWVKTGKSECKIAAIGIRIRRGVSFHGISINVNPDLSHFDAIVPCGISQYGVTSLHHLGKEVSMKDVDWALQQEFKQMFSLRNISQIVTKA